MTQTDALRAVIEAARKWAHAEGSDAVEDAAEALQDAVAALEAGLTAESSGFIVKRMWGEQEPGNWVSPESSPGKWFRIVDVVPWNNDNGTVDVTIDVNGRELKAPRPATVQVRTRTRTKRTVTERAIELLSESFSGTEVV